MTAGKDIIETFRDVAQDLLVPELKAVKVSVDSLRIEMKLTTEAIREEMKLNSQLLREEMKFRHESLEQTIRESKERHSQEIRSLSDKIDERMQVRERLAALEARLPKQ
jgi:hypothetical protein